MKPVCSMDLCDQFSVLLVCLYIDDLLVSDIIWFLHEELVFDFSLFCIIDS